MDASNAIKKAKNGKYVEPYTYIVDVVVEEEAKGNICVYTGRRAKKLILTIEGCRYAQALSNGA